MWRFLNALPRVCITKANLMSLLKPKSREKKSVSRIGVWGEWAVTSFRVGKWNESTTWEPKLHLDKFERVTFWNRVKKNIKLSTITVNLNTNCPTHILLLQKYKSQNCEVMPCLHLFSRWRSTIASKMTCVEKEYVENDKHRKWHAWKMARGENFMRRTWHPPYYDDHTNCNKGLFHIILSLLKLNPSQAVTIGAPVQSRYFDALVFSFFCSASDWLDWRWSLLL